MYKADQYNTTPAMKKKTSWLRPVGQIYFTLPTFDSHTSTHTHKKTETEKLVSISLLRAKFCGLKRLCSV